jgi:hypothetical protein
VKNGRSSVGGRSWKKPWNGEPGAGQDRGRLQPQRVGAAGRRLVGRGEGHERQTVVDPHARKIAAGEMDHVERALVAEAPDGFQRRGLERVGRQEQPHVEGRAVDRDMPRGLGHAGARSAASAATMACTA